MTEELLLWFSLWQNSLLNSFHYITTWNTCWDLQVILKRHQTKGKVPMERVDSRLKSGSLCKAPSKFLVKWITYPHFTDLRVRIQHRCCCETSNIYDLQLAGACLSAKYHYYSLQIWVLLSASVPLQGWNYCLPRRSPEKADSTPL